MPSVLFEQVWRGHEVTWVRTQFGLLSVKGLSAFLDGIAGLFVMFSMSYLMISATVVHDSAGLAKGELRFTAIHVAVRAARNG